MLKEFAIETSLKEETIDTIVIGGGQSGLAVGYYLSKQGRKFVILDDRSRTGDVWRSRWESLRLFTPSQFDSLPGVPFSQAKNYLPSKDEIADYLEEYANHLHLPVRHNIRVEKLEYCQSRYKISSNGGIFFSKNVIIATGPFQIPYIPDFSNSFDPKIMQIHSNDYKNPQQISGKNILIVGAGNSGAEIALELVNNGKNIWLSGRDVGRIPANSPIGKILDGRLIWWIMTHIMTVETPIGRKMKANTVHHGTPLGRVSRDLITEAGVILKPKLKGVVSGKPQLENGEIFDADVIIWATGFKSDYSWIKLPIFDENGDPIQDHGLSVNQPGLFFIGLPFLTGLSSSLLGGVGKDGSFIGAHLLT